MSKNQVSHLEDHLGYWLRCLSNQVHESFSQKLEAFGVSVAQWVVLRLLYQEKAIPLNQAADLLGVDKSSLSRMIERLVQRGLVNRAQGHNRRSLSLQLTPKAEVLVPQLALLADENDHLFFKNLSQTQKDDLLALIKKLLQDNGWDGANQNHHALN